MRTMQPVVLNGRSTWDQEFLPIDEFEERIKAIRKIMSERKLLALVIFGNSQSYELLCYFTNSIPMTRWAMLLIPLEGDIRLIISTSTRDLQFYHKWTFLYDIQTNEHLSDQLDNWLKENLRFDGTVHSTPAIGLAGDLLMTMPVHETVTKACEPYGAVSIEDELRKTLRRKRPRELIALRMACEVLRTATEPLFEQISSPNGLKVKRDALIDVQRRARNMGAHDVRLMFSDTKFDELRDVSEASNEIQIPVVFYVAVEFLGYWADGFITINQDKTMISEARRILHSMIDQAGATAKFDQDEREVGMSSAGYLPHPITGKTIARGIGLSLDEQPHIDSQRSTLLQNGDVLSFQLGLKARNGDQAIVSAIAHFNAGRLELLWESPKN